MPSINPLRQQLAVKRTDGGEPPNPYAKLYGLRENPFPSLAIFQTAVPDPRRNGEIYDPEFRRDEEKRFFRLFVQPDSRDPLGIGFLRLDPQAGGRGNGKSTFLHRLMLRVNNQDWEDWSINTNDPQLFGLAVHVLPEPRSVKSFAHLVQHVFKSLMIRGALSKDKNLANKVDVDFHAAVLFSMLGDDELKGLLEMPPEELTSSLETRDGLGRLLAGCNLDWDGYDDAARKLLSSSDAPVDPEVLDTLASAEWQVTGLCKELLAKSSYRWQQNGARWLIHGFLPLLMAAGYRRFYLLIDEFERIYISQTSRKRDEFLDSFRHHLYESPSAAVARKFVSTLLTIHPSIDDYLLANWARTGLEQLAPLTKPRTPTHTISLGASNTQKLDHLLITYMDYFRIDEAHHGTPHPFEEGAMEPAMTAARFYPRTTLWYAYEILHQAVTSSVAAPIPRRFVEDFVADHPTPPEDEEDRLFATLPSSRADLTE